MYFNLFDDQARQGFITECSNADPYLSNGIGLSLQRNSNFLAIRFLSGQLTWCIRDMPFLTCYAISQITQGFLGGIPCLIEGKLTRVSYFSALIGSRSHKGTTFCADQKRLTTAVNN